jgi:hypothetical protein
MDRPAPAATRAPAGTALGDKLVLARGLTEGLNVLKQRHEIERLFAVEIAEIEQAAGKRVRTCSPAPSASTNSGAQTPTASLKGLRVYRSAPRREAAEEERAPRPAMAIARSAAATCGIISRTACPPWPRLRSSAFSRGKFAWTESCLSILTKLKILDVLWGRGSKPR